ncbi:protein FAM161B isoform X2 [Hypanus sabinus]|uniref:protein FAM161B isoform X2 n=1 Tax=Hypanus sabinus TaxID=79690 RepID=UPI0028C3C666|nr:protein FAM161B isoform X2 [Hypanus sabinus]
MPGSFGTPFSTDTHPKRRPRRQDWPPDSGQTEFPLGDGGWLEVTPETGADSDDESPNVELSKSNKGALMDFLSQDEGNLNKQYYERLMTLKNSGRQRLLALGMQYEQQKNKFKSEDEGKMEDIGLTEEVIKFFAMNEGRIPADNRSSKPNSSGNIMRRNSYSGTEHCSLTDTKGSVKKDFLQPKKPSRPKSATSAWISQITVPQPFNMTMRESQKNTEVLRSRLTMEMEKQLVEKWQQEEAECQKKFRALPVPGHIYLQLYDEINERNEEKRKKETEKRQEYLLSTQKPFSFTKKEESRKEKLKQQLCAVVPETERTVKRIKKIPRSVQDPSVSEKLKDELYRKIRIQMRAEDLLKKAAAPIDHKPKNPVTTSSMRTRQEKLSFLEEKPKFKPRINPEIPDYTKLYNAFQRGTRKETKVSTKCVPFELQTSKLPPHQSKAKTIVPKEKAKIHLKRSNSFSDIRSLSSHTLPISTTNAARKRQSAVRKSLEERGKQETEKAEWMERYKKNVQDISKTVSIRAKAMDPHQSLAETFKEVLKKHRQADLRRKQEYKKELEEMKRRVCSRPYLFEQVTQKNATFEAEKRYREALRQAGVDEEFVWDKGGNAEDIPLSIPDIEESSHDSADREKNNCYRSSESLENFKSLDEEKNFKIRDEENEEQDEDGEQETSSNTDQENYLDSQLKENSASEQDE